MARGERVLNLAGDTLAMDLFNTAAVGLQVIGAFTGTVGLEHSTDAGTTWEPVQIQKHDGTAAAASLAAPGGAQSVKALPPGVVRARALTLTAGTPKVIVTTAAA